MEPIPDTLVTPAAARHDGKVLIHLADVARALSARDVDELLDGLPRGPADLAGYVTVVRTGGGRTEYISPAGVDYLLNRLYRIEAVLSSTVVAGGHPSDQELDVIIEGLPVPAQKDAQRRAVVDCGGGDRRAVDILLPRWGIAVLLSGISGGSDALRRKYVVVTGGARLLQTISRINTAILAASCGRSI